MKHLFSAILLLFFFCSIKTIQSQSSCATSALIPGLPFSSAKKNSCANTQTPDSGSCITGNSFEGGKLYYRYTPTSDQCVNLYAQVNDSIVKAYDGQFSMVILNGCPSISGTNCIATINTDIGRIKSLIQLKNLTLASGKTYYIVLSGNKSINSGVVCFQDIDFRIAKCYTPDPPVNTDDLVACGNNNVDIEAGSLMGWNGCYSLGGKTNKPPYDPYDSSRLSTMGFKCGNSGVKGGGTIINGPLGSFLGIREPPPPDDVQHTVTSGAWKDTASNFNIQIVAPVPGNKFSARLGNLNVGFGAECMWNTFSVSSENALFTYMYAVVFQDPEHAFNDRPRFTATIRDEAGKPLACSADFDIMSIGANDNGFISCDSMVPNGWYKDWSAVTTDLSPYIGQKVTIKFCTADCAQGGHFGYAYIDAFCKKKEITNSVLCGKNILKAPGGFDGYKWYSGASSTGLPIGNEQSLVVDAPKIGDIYTVTAESKANSACLISITDTIRNIAVTGTAFDLGKDTIVCNIVDMVLDAKNYGQKHLWSTGDTTQTMHVTKPGKYWVNVGTGSCILTDTINIMKKNAPQVSHEEVVSCKSETLDALLSGQYVWSTGETTKAITVITGGTYTVTVTPPGSLCPSDIKIFHVELPGTIDDTLHVPNVFTPNRDGKNETFKIQGSQSPRTEFNIKIYDRWGLLMFESSDITVSWDGYFKGKTAPQGIYYYILNYKDECPNHNKDTMRYGFLTLIR